MTLTCACGAVCRIPSVPRTRVRCGKCKHEFTPRELAKARPEQPEDFNLVPEADADAWFEDENDDEEDPW